MLTDDDLAHWDIRSHPRPAARSRDRGVVGIPVAGRRLKILTARQALIRIIAGRPPQWTTAYNRIGTLWGALLWRIASLPGLDADVREDGSVRVWRLR